MERLNSKLTKLGGHVQKHIVSNFWGNCETGETFNDIFIIKFLYFFF